MKRFPRLTLPAHAGWTKARVASGAAPRETRRLKVGRQNRSLQRRGAAWFKAKPGSSLPSAR